MRARVAAAALWIGAGAALWAAIIAVTGGVRLDVAGMRVSSQTAIRPAALAAAALAAYFSLAGFAPLRRLLSSIEHRIPVRAGVVVLSLAVVAVSVTFTSRTAGGSDSYGYISEADLWLAHALVTPMPAAADAPWPNALLTLTPLGYVPAPGGGAIVPSYAPGLPLLMAGAKLVAGQRAIFWIAPLLAGLLVLSTCEIGARLGSRVMGAAGAWLVATSPVVLHAAVQPMTDVPTAALWGAAVWCLLGESTGAAAAGAGCAGLALLMRPNLLLVAGVIVVWLAYRDWMSRRGLMRFTRVAMLVCSLGISALAIALVNRSLFGSAFHTGYGDAGQLFSIANVPINLARYASWIADTHTLVMFAGLVIMAAPVRALWPTTSARRGAVILGLMFAAVGVSYAGYRPFDDWTYLRFLLPAWPALCLGVGALLSRLIEPRPSIAGSIALAVVIVLGVHNLGRARELGTYTLRDNERRYDAVATMVSEMTEPTAIVLSMQHSGSIRYYGGRNILRYDRLDPLWLDRTLAWLESHGAHPYLVLEEWEQRDFRERFDGKSPLAALALTPIAVYEHGQPAYLYDLGAHAAARAPRTVTAPPERQPLLPAILPPVIFVR